MALAKLSVVCRVERDVSVNAFTPLQTIRATSRELTSGEAGDSVLGVCLTESAQTQPCGGGKNNFFMLTSSG